ncbi:MAG: nucleoside triphosphate pyrophosphohydrolase [Saprospiraceae bacterium]|nr:nucleoside triphosphate pyrophosphohydrolase [Saprospiraceae bacterium]
MRKNAAAGEAFERLADLMDTLREQCPWDAKQTIPSLQKYTLEEVYELMDAINEKQLGEVEEELGDILFHTLFYSKIASESNDFNITSVITKVHEKLVRRHPHIFGDVEVQNDKDVSKNWEQIKLAEGKKSVLSGVPKSLPALIKAFRIQEKAKQVGFEWENAQQVWEKVEEEMLEFKAISVGENQREKQEEEFGDILFSLINYARYVDIDPEAALEKTNKKFISRFSYMENYAKNNSKSLKDMSLEEMEQLWQEAKK